MRYQFDFRSYRRKFKRPMHTSHGIWEVRDGIIVRLKNEKGDVGWGEIAPLSAFGSETIGEALEFCQKLPEWISDRTIFSLPPNLPACQFGLETAWEACSTHKLLPDDAGRSPAIDIPFATLTYSGLLPAGEAALLGHKILWKQGYRTFKWKIGVAPIERELRIFRELVRSICEDWQEDIGFLRLDANGGLNLAEAEKWLEACDKAGEIIEFLEQPLPVGEFETMLELSTRFSTAIALDESVATLAQMEAAYRQGWRGLFSIKPCISGSPSQLRQFCQLNKIDAVFSSVFETQIGRNAALKLATEISTPRDRAVGFGVNHWFADDEIAIEELWQNP
ncbi:o-succinylbenzoate synthase [Phormidium sp. CCY1219]|uniref:o-succinylbenzoate synthase n=1 Tax=Phormidium sp. CCY1219 TaxID=2886104 RepID=UPI002D1F43DF|nr:o-succinylbenzoate synthase [Phormidium sp. CCY1219]MEB3829868.1 o-succinylbenzoate synthase [Phormidium sp. CCY1219]